LLHVHRSLVRPEITGLGRGAHHERRGNSEHHRQFHAFPQHGLNLLRAVEHRGPEVAAASADRRATPFAGSIVARMRSAV
jgi:hypothetical protein